MKTFIADIPLTTHTALKVYAASIGEPMCKVVDKAILAYVGKTEVKKK